MAVVILLVLMILRAASSGTLTSDGCSEGWYTSDTVEHCYRVSTFTGDMWVDGYPCNKNNSSDVSILSTQENQFVLKLMNRFNVETAWMGLHWSGNQQMWRWWAVPGRKSQKTNRLWENLTRSTRRGLRYNVPVTYTDWGAEINSKPVDRHRIGVITVDNHWVYDHISSRHHYICQSWQQKLDVKSETGVATADKKEVTINIQRYERLKNKLRGCLTQLRTLTEQLSHVNSNHGNLVTYRNRYRGKQRKKQRVARNCKILQDRVSRMLEH